MAGWGEFYGSNYLNSSDFANEEAEYKIVGFEINSVRSDDQGERERVCILLEGLEKPMILNASNAEILQEAYGSEVESIVGKAIGIKTGKVKYMGKWVDGVKVRPISKAK